REDDKKGYDTVAPISRAAREALDTYLRRGARAGDVPLFPGQQDATKPVTKETAGYWLTRAEKLANLPHFARGGFHPFRRLWASERRHLPAQDVAAAGGWRSLQVMREAYQHADAATMYSVVDRAAPPEPDPKSAPSGHKSDTPQEKAASAQ
ncbi:MAG TPA: tyrosine-type recombinase/integrase, partial [Gemmatimonadaceae bacterium]